MIYNRFNKRIRPGQKTDKRTNAPAKETSDTPHSIFCGTLVFPRDNRTIFRFKAPRKVVFKNAKLIIKEMSVPTDTEARLVLEGWLDGVYGGETILSTGTNEFPNVPLEALAEIELRLKMRTDSEAATLAASDVWLVFCME